MLMHEKLKGYITTQGLSQKIIAKNAGWTESKLSLMLSGRRRMTVDDYEVLCKAIAVSPARFYAEHSQTQN